MENWDFSRRLVPEWSLGELEGYEWTGAVILTPDGVELFEIKLEGISNDGSRDE